MQLDNYEQLAEQLDSGPEHEPVYAPSPRLRVLASSRPSAGVLAPRRARRNAQYFDFSFKTWKSRNIWPVSQTLQIRELL